MEILRSPWAATKVIPTGWYPALCVDVEDLGTVETPWGDRRTIKVVWEVDVRSVHSGKRLTVSRKLHRTLARDSHLRRLLKTWLTDEMPDWRLEQGVDLEYLVGKWAIVFVEQRVSGASSVREALPLPPHVSKWCPERTYIRAQYRKESGWTKTSSSSCSSEDSSLGVSAPSSSNNSSEVISFEIPITDQMPPETTLDLDRPSMTTDKPDETS